MKLVLTTDRIDRGAEQYAGDVLDLPKAEAGALLAAGQAELLRGRAGGRQPPDADQESAALAAPETAMRPRAARRNA